MSTNTKTTRVQTSGHTLVLATVLAVLAFTLVAPVAYAHEGKELAGGFTVTFGLADEPGFTDQRNQLNFKVTRNGEPVPGLEDVIEIEVEKKGTTMKLEFSSEDVGAIHGREGWYDAEILFTEPGTYIVHFRAHVEGLDEGLHTHFEKEVSDLRDITFPDRDYNIETLSERLDTLENEMANGSNNMPLLASGGAIVAVAAVVMAGWSLRRKK